MTIINNIEIDIINYKKNIIKEAIINNDPIENKLHVIIVISNPCLYARRYILARDFIKRFEEEETDVILYVVEMIYPGQKFIVTDSKNKRHLQLKTEVPIWHKENMINVGVKKLLPKNWKAFAWIDADIEFENPSWAMDTLKILNGTKDIVQIYSHCVDLNQNNIAMNVFNSFGYKFTKEEPYSNVGINYWHPGFAWACTKKAYLKMNGLYDQGILGSGDNIMALSFINNGLKAINEFSSEEYKESILHFQNNVKNLRLGYVPGVIKHYFHGTKKNRRYTERWKILLDYNYSPKIHIKYNKEGILVPTNDCPGELLDSILNYFKERNEDEFYN
uniref:Glycosyltransferase n=1 Tax=viral metagenome TaxID=1070528 RepID=A0A6C0DBW3_9ZZZZ